MEWLLYVLKVSACTFIFYACYYVFLEKLTFFSFNRYCLLAILSLSFLIPARQFVVHRNTKVPQSINNYYVVIVNKGHTGSDPSGLKVMENTSGLHIKWETTFISFYWVAVLILIALFIFRLMRLLSATFVPYRSSGNLKLITKLDGFKNCSFLNYVFLNKQELSSEELSVLLKHESVHSVRLHSIDRLFISVCKALLWFNPVIYLIDRSLEQVHEFEADQLTSSSVGIRDYAQLLLDMAIRENTSSLVHSFAKNPLKLRIKMLFTNPSTHLKRFTYLLLIPVCCFLIGVFGIKFVYAGPAHLDFGSYERPSFPGPDIDSCFSKFPLKNKVRLIGWGSAANPKVTIDGKKYSAEILTKISPRCVKIAEVNYQDITLTTYHHKIEFATTTDVENSLTIASAEKSGNNYIRYSLKNERGKIFDYVQLSADQFGFGFFISPNKKVLIIIDGKKYPEGAANSFDKSTIKPGSTFKIMKTYADMRTSYPQYAQEYGAVIQIKKPE